MTFALTLLVQFLIVAFIIASAILAIGFPVVLASNEDMGDVIGFSVKGGTVWLGLLALLAVTSLLVL